MKALEYLLNFKTNKAMMGDTNGQVKTLKENILGVGTGIDKVHKQLSKFANSQKWANITSLTSNVAAGFANIAGNVKNTFAGAYGFMDQFASKGDKIAKTSRLVGLSVKDYQGLAFAADRSGIGLETMNTALKKFNETLGKAQSGDKNAKKIFGALLPENVNSYKNGKDVLLAMADSYTKLSASQKAFVSGQVFGRGGFQMAELFAGGGAGVQALLQQYEDLGGGFSDAAAAGAETFKDDLTNMNVTLESMKITVASELLPAFSDLFKTVTKYFKDNKGEIQKSIKDFSLKFISGIKELLPKLPAVFAAFVSIAGVVGQIVEYLGPIKSIIGVALIGSLGSIVSIVTSLVGLLGGPVVAGIAAAAVGITAWVSAIKSVYDNFEMLKSFVCDDLFGGVSDALENSIAGGIVRGIRKAVKAIPVLGDLVFSDVDFSAADASAGVANDLGSQMVDLMKSTNTTTTNRFSVDFKNMPKGVTVTPPPAGDFDYSYGYTLGGL